MFSKWWRGGRGEGSFKARHAASGAIPRRQSRRNLTIESLERRLALSANLELIGSPYLVDEDDVPFDPSAVPEGCPVFIHKEWLATDLPDTGGTYVVQNEVDGVDLHHPGGWPWGVGVPGTTGWYEWWGGWQTDPGVHQASATLDAFNEFSESDEGDNSGSFEFTTVAKPTVTIRATDPVAMEEGQVPATFTITREGNTAFKMPVHLSFSGTATAGVDYGELPDTVYMPRGVSSITVSVVPFDDSETESRETVVVTIAPEDCYAIEADGSATAEIADNDPEISIVATTPNASEVGPSPGVFTVTRTGDSAGALSVYYTVGGTATAGSDYVKLPQQLDFGPGESTRTIVVTPFDDTIAEGDETVVVTLLGDSKYKVGADGTATVTIADDDQPVVQIDINGTAAEEDDITYLDGNHAQTITAVVTNTGGAGVIDLSVNPAGAAKLDRTLVTLAHGASTTITITPTLVSGAANDVQIVAASGGYEVGKEDMTIVRVVLPDHIRAGNTPAGMPDRIPPRVDTLSGVVIVPDLAGSGQLVNLGIAGNGGNNGTATIDGQDSVDLGSGGPIRLSSPNGSTQTAPGSAGHLQLEVRVRGESVAQGRGFSVAAIPQNWSMAYDTYETGQFRGFRTKDSVGSDSGVTGDLDQVRVSEVIEVRARSGVLGGLKVQVGGYFRALDLPGKRDVHAVAVAALARAGSFGGGDATLAQTHKFQDLRTGAIDMPIANSGYTITFELVPLPIIDVRTGRIRFDWILRTTKKGAATSAQGIGSQAGGGGTVSTDATIDDPLLSGP